ncbi:hypothetical protein EYR36_001066 [Pleurotus pulmonarius]|nr:hypothetical protein EYR36_001066 [Pleurotus pulmonarius]
MSADELTLPLPFALGIMALLNEAPLKRLSLAYWDFSADASDLILLLSVCSTTLEELSLENCSVPDSGTTLPKTIISESSVPPIVCLEALRTVRLQGDFKAFQTSRIETPNLRSLACEYFERPFCSIPSWISDDKVSELRLKVVEVSDILDFGQSICPSSLLIDILKSPEGSFFSVVTWIKRCIEGLPFPNALRKLNIEVRSNQLNEVSNPTRADYELLRRTLQPLHQHGSLQHTNLRIGTLLFNHHTALFDDIATREVEKLRGVFTPLLEANQLTIDVVFERWGQVEEPAPAWLPTCFKRFENLRKLHVSCFASVPSPFSALHTLGITSLLAAGRVEHFQMECYDLVEDDAGLLPIFSLCSSTLEEITLCLCVDRPGAQHVTFPHWKPGPRDQETVCLKALRKLDFEEDVPRLHETNRIECPNLECLTITHNSSSPWWIPSWIPASLPELVLKVSDKWAVPDFATFVRPSRITIDICKSDRGSYRTVLAWIKDCIDHLPSPNDLRQLTIRIKVYCVRPLEVFDYPTFEDHQELYRVIEPLHRHGTIERINLQFATENWRFEPIPADKTKEIATMQEVFAPLLEGGQFAVAVEH